MTTLRIATANVNGIRAAQRRGMPAWLNEAQPDVIAVQEVRAPLGHLDERLGSQWSVAAAASATKGRGGVAVASRRPLASYAADGPAPRFSEAGRWVEAVVDVPSADSSGPPEGRQLVVCSCYAHTGDADDDEKMEEKLAFLDSVIERLEQLRSDHPLVVVGGDFNVARDERDIKNWRGNRGKAGFLPEERMRLDELESRGFTDLGRLSAGDVAGPYTWWSWRGRAFDNDAGWRIDYLFASKQLTEALAGVEVGRAASYDERWSDHAPVLATFRF